MPGEELLRPPRGHMAGNARGAAAKMPAGSATWTAAASMARGASGREGAELGGRAAGHGRGRKKSLCGGEGQSSCGGATLCWLPLPIVPPCHRPRKELRAATYVTADFFLIINRCCNFLYHIFDVANGKFLRCLTVLHGHNFSML